MIVATAKTDFIHEVIEATPSAETLLNCLQSGIRRVLSVRTGYGPDALSACYA
jgi:hypothetical protein